MLSGHEAPIAPASAAKKCSSTAISGSPSAKTNSNTPYIRAKKMGMPTNLFRNMQSSILVAFARAWARVFRHGMQMSSIILYLAAATSAPGFSSVWASSSAAQAFAAS